MSLLLVGDFFSTARLDSDAGGVAGWLDFLSRLGWIFLRHCLVDFSSSQSDVFPPGTIHLGPSFSDTG